MNALLPGIYGFFGEYRWLSNFWYAEVQLDGKYYPSTEHAYQAAKTLDDTLRREFRFRLARDGGNEPVEKTITCGQAKRLGSKLPLRSDWEDVKLQVMEDLLRQKFAPGSELAQKLIATADLYIEETNTWKDTFWGVCNGKGENYLGKLLMKIRHELLTS